MSYVLLIRLLLGINSVFICPRYLFMIYLLSTAGLGINFIQWITSKLNNTKVWLMLDV